MHKCLAWVKQLVKHLFKFAVGRAGEDACCQELYATH